MSRLLSSKTAQILAERFAQCERSNAPVALTVPRAALRSTLGYLILPLWGVGIHGSLNESRWSFAPTERTGIAQGKAKTGRGNDH